MANEVLRRGFSRHEKKKVAIWAVLGSFVMALSFCAVVNYYMVNLQLLSSFNLKVLSFIDISNYQRGDLLVEEPFLSCNFSNPRSDFCEIKGDARINGNSTIIFPSSSYSQDTLRKLKPYARKIDRTAMKKVKEVSIGPASSFGLDEPPQCSINHTDPAIVFSTGGYVGNIFHEFSDMLIPLFITSRPFNGKVQLVITDAKPVWIVKYRDLLASMTKHTIIDMDSSKEVHCFPSMIVGLKSHKEFGLDPLQNPPGYTIRNFTEFVRNAYSLKRSKVERIGEGSFRKPRLMIISRRWSRMLVNEDEVAEEARRLGYDAFVLKAMMDVKDFSTKVNSFDVLVAVHGAGLTNCIFLPENAVVIQIVPVGLEWLAKHDYEKPEIDMNLRYLEYNVSGNESSLSDKYSVQGQIIQNPGMEQLKPPNWATFKKVYMDEQNVKIDLGRFRPTLLKALELLRQ